MDISFDSAGQFFSSVSLYFKRMQFGAKKQIAFLEDFYTLLNDGIPANRAIEMLGQVTTGLTRDVALSIAQKISEGQPLAEGMRDWFSVNIVEVIRIGEEGGALLQTVKSAMNTLGRRSGSMGAVISAMAYPVVVIITACIVIVYLKNSVFNQFAAIKPMEQWPQAGRDLISLANLIQSWWWLFLVVIVALIIMFRIVVANYVGEFRPLLDKIPPFSLYRRFAASRLMETLGLLVANGMVFKAAIKVMQYHANPYLTSHLIMMEHLLGMGKGNVADVLDTGLIEQKDLMRLRVMAEVKGFEHGLIRMGLYGSEENTRTVRLIAKILGAVLLLFGGILILVIVRGIYLTGMVMGNV